MGQALFFSALIYSSPFSCLPTTFQTACVLCTLVLLIKSCAHTVSCLVCICGVFSRPFREVKGDYFSLCYSVGSLITITNNQMLLLLTDVNYCF